LGEYKTLNNPYFIVRQFEQSICNFTGSPYCVTVESCSAALFLSCLYRKVKDIPEIVIPKVTYPSAACSIVNAGGRIRFSDIEWQQSGWYYFVNAGIVDSAKYLCKNMYEFFDGELVCLSFHAKKTIPIGRGGAILTESKDAYEWLKLMRFDGRHECALDKDSLAMAGFNMMMTVEQAARGLEFMQWIKDINVLKPDKYLDLSGYKFFTEANRENKK
jgi:dTDP-4-amino-4,6-dideoxygalactose transaminase